MCWHVAKVLRLQGSSEHALLRHMGLFVGSKQGGYWQLKAATEGKCMPPQMPCSRAHSSIQRATSAMLCSSPKDHSVHQQPQPCASSQQVKHLHSTRRRHWKRWAVFVACKNGWSEDSPNWRWLTVAAKQATNDLHDMCSKTTLDSLKRSSSSPAFATNAEALPGNNLKRQLSYVDLPGRRKAAKQPLSRFAQALPFVGVWLTQPKPQIELESIRLKNKQLGVQPAAGAGEAAASHAGRLSILQPSAGD